jgi:hypothetical protein
MNTISYGNIKTEDTPEDVAKKLYLRSGFNGDYTICQEEDMFYLKDIRENMEFDIKTKKVSNDNTIYASMELSQYNGVMNIINIRRAFFEAFSSYGVKPFFSSLIQGKYKEKLSLKQMKEKASNLFEMSNATYVDGMWDDRLVSLCGVVSDVEEKERYVNSDKYVNFNIALRSSETNGCTYIWIGSPIIKDEY